MVGLQNGKKRYKDKKKKKTSRNRQYNNKIIIRPSFPKSVRKLRVVSKCSNHPRHRRNKDVLLQDILLLADTLSQVNRLISVRKHILISIWAPCCLVPVSSSINLKHHPKCLNHFFHYVSQEKSANWRLKQ